MALSEPWRTAVDWLPLIGALFAVMGFIASSMFLYARYRLDRARLSRLERAHANMARVVRKREHTLRGWLQHHQTILELLWSDVVKAEMPSRDERENEWPDLQSPPDDSR